MLTAEPPAGTPGDLNPAFSKLAMRHRAPLLAYCTRLVGPDHAEDVLQQTMLKAWLALEQQSVDVTNPRAWLYRIAHNQAMDHLRRAGAPWDELDCEWESPESTERAVEAQERLGRVSEGIRGLPIRQREALVMHSLRGDSYADIAVKMDTNVPSVSQLITRARARLREIPAVVPAWLVVRRLTGAARRATAGLSGSTKAAVVAVTVATGAAVPLVVDEDRRQAPAPAGPAAIGARPSPSPTHAESAAKPRRAARSRHASVRAGETIRSDVAFPVIATTPATPDSLGSASLEPDGPGGASHGSTDSVRTDSSGGPAPGAAPVSGGVSVSTSLPGVATLGVDAAVSTRIPVRLPSAAVPAAPSLPQLPRR
jgi:RNA polymerase sigma factor (sigma-70 family)